MAPETPDPALSHTVGGTEPPLLEQTIGDNLDEEPCAWVRMREGAQPLTAESLREFATGRLAHYKIPRYVRVVDGFPMTVTGKVRKVEMREVSISELGL